MGEALVPAWVGLGSNLAAPRKQLESALAGLAALPATRVLRVSSFYRTAPVGYAGQPDFINAVAAIETGLAPRALLEALLDIERRHGRIRTIANGPRTLDLDLLLHGDQRIDEPGLTLPHPRMHERAFVMVPLAEIAPELAIPGRGVAADLARALVGSQRVERSESD